MIAGERKHPAIIASEKTDSERQVYYKEKAKAEKEFYKEYRCCSIQDCNRRDDSTKKCCYELYQSGEGSNVKHHLEMNTASVIRDAMKPAFEAAKASIEAGSSSEEIAKAVLAEYEKANEQFTLSVRNAVLEEKISREAKEQAAAKALAKAKAEEKTSREAEENATAVQQRQPLQSPRQDDMYVPTCGVILWGTTNTECV